MPAKLIITKGQKFNSLIIIKELPNHIQPSGHPERKFLCKCNCRNKTEVLLRSLKSGHTKSCGCLQIESAIKLTTKHGLARTRLYIIWNGINGQMQ